MQAPSPHMTAAAAASTGTYTLGTGTRPASDSGFAAANFEAQRGFTVTEIEEAQQFRSDWIEERAGQLAKDIKREQGGRFLSLAVERAISKPLREAIEGFIDDPEALELGAGSGFQSMLEAMIREECQAYQDRLLMSEARERAEAEWSAHADTNKEAA